MAALIIYYYHNMSTVGKGKRYRENIQEHFPCAGRTQNVSTCPHT